MILKIDKLNRLAWSYEFNSEESIGEPLRVSGEEGGK